MFEVQRLEEQGQSSLRKIECALTVQGTTLAPYILKMRIDVPIRVVA